ncbi:DEAD/DEAH box helicase-like [Bradyrhizobium sp. ORS 285]|uniref:DEAD/DEAH box helicase n=1 Tax=Bradyrhizobium sp. ORS 285 TaxID=115808 RepID=UPI0002407E60|nr:DEAD/DEAH box helicase [Bradyrhizobium sp. ORS 285]CCD86202.1 DEAD/DEAH box helicase-like [Bradyrhizobium sp. ORS 285]SMX61031.1 DEAD/DEAH box helicase-like [Bradyrhizobium sp. ORS 285]
MTAKITPPSVSVQYGQTGASTKANELGMRTMQERAYAKRGEQYLLIKSPPASGKSRALMFIALDKLNNQDVKQAIVVVPERSIGGSFADEPLSKFGFPYDWNVAPQWSLCNAPGADDVRVARSKVAAVREFLASSDKALVCTHATFRFAVEELGIEAFDGRLIAIDEFHHVSASGDNVLGTQLGAFLARDKVQIIAMTGSYFRGDAVPVLAPEDEIKFQTVTYTYYEQLNGYEHLKQLDLGYFFYSGRYTDAVDKVLDPDKKTIVHIPNVNSRESLGDKLRETEEIMHALGTWKGEDVLTGFHLVERPDGRILRIADLVDPARQARTIAALKDPAQKNNRDHVDIIIALGMAKEGFDWIWCEHALTIGYRNSLTEIIQIIGRATRDAPGKPKARFTNLIAEPDAAEDTVVDAVNDTLKAIAASLLMEQVLAPRFNFTPRNTDDGRLDGYDYGEGGYKPGGSNVGFDEATGQFHIEIKGLVEPESAEAARICQEDINEVITAFVQDTRTVERGLFDEDTVPEELTQLKMGDIVRDKYPDLTETDREAIRQRAVAALTLVQQARKAAEGGATTNGPGEIGGGDPVANTAFIDGVRRFVNVRDLDIDMIDRINPFGPAFAILSKTLDPKILKQVQEAIAAKRTTIPAEEARDLAVRAVKFKKERGRLPDITSNDAWEKRLAEGRLAFGKHKASGAYDE